MKRSIAIAEVFRQSGGKQPFTIKSLTDALLKDYPHLFPSGRPPSQDTIQRAVDILMECLPITRSTAEKVGIPVEGSRKQVVWTYTPDKTAMKSLEHLSDYKERVDFLISLAVAAEAFDPYRGLPIHDGLVALQESFEKHDIAAHDRRRAKRTSARYAVRVGKKSRGTLEENQIRNRLRTMNKCINENRRLKIRLKHEYGQKEEPEYVLEPRGYRPHNGSVFLYAHVVTPRRDNLHLFKLDRITYAEDLHQSNELEFDGDGNLTGRRWPSTLKDIPDFPLQKVLSFTIHNYIPPPTEKPVRNVEIEVRKERAKWVNEEMLNPQQKTSRITLADGSPGLRVMIDKAYVNDITPRLLGLGPYVRVVNPPKLRDHMRAMLEAAVKQYTPSVASGIGEGGKPPAPQRSEAQRLYATGSDARTVAIDGMDDEGIR